MAQWNKNVDKIIYKPEKEGTKSDIVINNNTEYRLKESCKLIEVYKGVYNPMCKKDLFLNYRDNQWRFCPFCGGKLKQNIE